MRLERIRLQKFGCFEQQDFELSDGINLIFGPNFSGKSTLVNAIFFSLTGKAIVPRVDISNISSPSAQSGTAGLQFVIDGERYMLFRGTQRQCQLRNQKDGEWYIVLDDKRAAVVESALKERFGLIHDRLALTAFLREGEIFEFLARQPSSRRDILYALLGIDQLMDVRELFIETRRLAKREKSRIEAHQNSLRMIDQKNRKNDIEKIEIKIKDLETAYNTDIDTNLRDAELIVEWKKNRKQLMSELETLKRQLSATLKGFQNKKHLHEMKGTIEKAIKENSGIEVERDQIIQKIGNLESQIAALNKVCVALRTLIDSNEGHCPTCHQKVEKDVVQKIVEEKDNEKTELSAELEKHQNTLAEKTESLRNRQELEQRIQTLETKSIRVDQLEQKLPKVERELNTITERLSERGALEESETTIAAPQSPNTIPPNLNKGQLKTQIDNQRRRLQKLKQDEAVQLDRLDRLQQVNSEAEQVQQTLLSVELACSGIERTIETLQQQILKPAEEELHRWLQQMELFGSTRIDLLKQHLLPSVNIDGVDRSLMLLSGSEKMFLYLCFKVALAKVLGNTGFFVFDDPTLHLDDERKGLMVDFIRELSKEHQVVVTSYDNDVRLGLEGAHVIEMNREMKEQN